MEFCIKNDPSWGRIYFMTDGKTDVGVALDFGIRIVHLSCAGMENLYYRQPDDLSDSFTMGDWRLYGGHRMWLAPEGDHSYHPDNDPVSFKTLPDGVIVEQTLDPRQNIVKSLKITFEADGTLRLDHSFRNAGETVITGASWGINTLDGYGSATIGFSGVKGLNPSRTVSLWGDTNLNDSRLKFTKTEIQVQHAPSSDFFKIGVYSREGKAVFRNKGQQLTLRFDTPEMDSLPDNGCNFELFMSKQFLELEVLGVKTEIRPGKAACHTERIALKKL